MSDRYLRVHEVAEMLSVGKSTIWAWCKAGKFPAAIKLGDRVTVWRLSEIEEWVSSKNVSKNIL